MVTFEKLVQDPVGFVQTDPLGQTVLAPFAVALVVTLVLRLVGGGSVGRRIAAAGIGLGFLAAFVLIFGVPTGVPPTAAAGRIFWITGIGLALGLVVDAGGGARGGGPALAFLLPAASLIWLSRARYQELWPLALLLFAGSVLAYWRLAAAARGSEEPQERAAALFPPILLLVALAAFARITWNDGSGLALLAVALGAAVIGYFVVAYLFLLIGARPPRFDAAGAFGGAGAALALVYLALFAGRGADPIAVAILLLVFVADIRARQIAMGLVGGGGLVARAVQPFAYAVVVSIPAMAAILYTIYAPLIHARL